MLSGAIDGRLSRYPMFHQVCSLTVQNKTGTGILKLGESFCDGLRHTEGSSWYLIHAGGAGRKMIRRSSRGQPVTEKSLRRVNVQNVARRKTAEFR